MRVKKKFIELKRADNFYPYGFFSLCIAGILTILLILLFNILYFYTNIHAPEREIYIINNYTLSSSVQLPPDDIPKLYRSLDGIEVQDGFQNFRPYAVMIDNSYTSRPVLGLEYASIIYESISESSITRYLAIYDFYQDVKTLGPVRSARPYFINWADEWGSVYFHSGGSSDALKMLKSKSTYDIDEISSDGVYFWRDKKKLPPSNLFTSSERIKNAIEQKGIQTRSDVFYKPWLFKDDISIDQGPEVTNDITINFSTSQYKVDYRYDRTKNAYARYLWGEKHITAEGNQLYARNIILQFVNHTVLDDEGRLYINTKGSRDAIIFLDGKKIDGSWNFKDGRTRFYDLNNEEIRFNRGSIWIEILFDKSQFIEKYSFDS